jgi:hypothetical protein
MNGMNTTPELWNLGILALALVLALAASGFVLITWLQNLAARKKGAVVRGAIVDYFRKSGIEVDVICMPVPNSKRFMVFIESEPMKQMRLSHIIETSLRDMVHNLHRIELDKIYWRFPIKKRPDSPAASQGKKPNLDEYITEGLSLRHLPKTDVEEASLEDFQLAATRDPKPPQ